MSDFICKNCGKNVFIRLDDEDLCETCLDPSTLGSLPDVPPTIKKLNWSYYERDGIKTWSDESSIYGLCFKVVRSHSEQQFIVRSYPSMTSNVAFSTLEEAQQYCQDSFERIVRSCLE